MSLIFHMISAISALLGILMLVGGGMFFGNPTFFFGAALGAFATGAIIDKLNQIVAALGGGSVEKPKKKERDSIDDIPEQFRS